MVINSINLTRLRGYSRRGQTAATEYLVERPSGRRAPADLAILAANTAHLVYDGRRAARASHDQYHEATGDEVRRRGCGASACSARATR
jgi:aspartate/glutamate racemase